MRIGSLGTCLLLSALLNLVGFAPLMNFLLGRGGASRPSPRPPVQVRLLNARVEPPKQQNPLTPPKEVEKLPPPPLPKEKPKVAELPKDVKPIKSDQPEEVTPQARPKAAKPAQATPSGPLTRPDDKSSAMLPAPGTGNTAPFTTPGKATTPVPGNDGPPGEEPAPETESPTPTPSTSPLADNTNPQPAQPPISPGTNPSEGTIPEKPASPTTFPPQQNSRAVLRKLGGKSLIRVGLKIYPDGHIDSQIVLSSGNAELDSAVLKDLKDWKWNPAEAAGKPVLSERVIKLKLEAD